MCVTLLILSFIGSRVSFMTRLLNKDLIWVLLIRPLITATNLIIRAVGGGLARANIILQYKICLFKDIEPL